VGRASRAIEATWREEGHGLLPLVLRGLALPYGVAVAVRNRAFDRGWIASHRVPAHVVSVGNLVVGGSGKTPLTLWLAEGLAAAGRRPASVARGYGKRRRGVVVVGDGTGAVVSAADGGDEAVLMAQRFRGPVVTGEDRVAAAQTAIERFHVDTVVLDDGFQHRRLARDVDIVVTNGSPRSPRLLPAGPHREPQRSLARAHAIISTGATAPLQAACPVFRARMTPECLVRVRGSEWCSEPSTTLRGRAVVAVAGIARPERFLEDLARLGAHVTRSVLRPDHHAWSPAEVAEVLAAAGGAVVVTTEKDLVKWAVPPTASVWALRVGVDVENGSALVRLAGGAGMVCDDGGGAKPPRRRPHGHR